MAARARFQKGKNGVHIHYFLVVETGGLLVGLAPLVAGTGAFFVGAGCFVAGGDAFDVGVAGWGEGAGGLALVGAAADLDGAFFW